MSDDEKQFVQVPTMTIHVPKKKKSPGRALILGIAIMGIGILIAAIALYFLL